jgi:hypothetical protein
MPKLLAIPFIQQNGITLWEGIMLAIMIDFMARFLPPARPATASVVCDWERTAPADTVAPAMACTATRPVCGTCAPGDNEPWAFEPVIHRLDNDGSIVWDETDPGEARAEMLVVCECDDPLEQAQFWATMHQPDLVIGILEPVVETQTTPHGWLLLLEMYSMTERRSQYETLSQRFKTAYNAMAPAFDDYANTLKQRRLRDCPDLVRRIKDRLRSSSACAYLRALLLDDRNGQRRGFEMGVYRDLVRVHDAIKAGCHVEAALLCQ